MLLIVLVDCLFYMCFEFVCLLLYDCVYWVFWLFVLFVGFGLGWCLVVWVGCFCLFCCFRFDSGWFLLGVCCLWWRCDCFMFY